MRKTLIIIPLLLLGISAAAQPKLGKASIDKVIDAMTVEEKINLVVGSGGNKSAAASATVGDFGALVPGAAGQTNAIPRLGIPATTLADGPAGLRIDPTRIGTKGTFYCTHFPVEMLMSATWNTALMEEVGAAIGYETLHYGADVLLAPATNIMRNPLCGRNFEYLSEDPLLAGKMCAAEIRGLQSNGIGVSVKHFALNNQETNRTGNDARVSERAMEEIYLKPFEIAVKEGKPWTVMSSYNRINGTMASESKWLLEDRLRRDWGFDGMVMSDWYGGTDPVAMLKAGNDLLMPGNKKQVKALNKALENGTLTIKDLDRNVRRILEYILRTPAFNGYKADNEPDLEAHAAITRSAATEGMVLLKNNMTLPLNGCKAAVFGRTSYSFIAGGTGSGDVHHAYVVDLIQGLQNAGFTIDADLEKTYRAYIKKKDKGSPKGLKAFFPIELIPEMPLDDVDLLGLADANDVAVITIGKTSGEFEDRSITSNYALTDEEISMITK
ncbi:MAG: glycoside hydrolase family 3 C-terminal domain-containing protein, partial [Bacteroidales bacterium]|nr:glycoside hydrolase family 3 C-terminal domain-containing protein [Bacteroidales bacterium]